MWSSPNIHWFLHHLAPLLIPFTDSSNWGQGCRGPGRTTHKALHLGTPIAVIPGRETPLQLPCPAPFLGMTRMLECKTEGKGLLSPAPSTEPAATPAVGPGAGSQPALAFSLVLVNFFTLCSPRKLHFLQRCPSMCPHCGARDKSHAGLGPCDTMAPSVTPSMELGEHPAGMWELEVTACSTCGCTYRYVHVCMYASRACMWVCVGDL